jgi:hypothetical protein
MPDFGIISKPAQSSRPGFLLVALSCPEKPEMCEDSSTLPLSALKLFLPATL